MKMNLDFFYIFCISICFPWMSCTDKRKTRETHIIAHTDQSCDSNEDKISLYVSTDFFEQALKSASSYTKTVKSSSSFKKTLNQLSTSASVSGSFGGFSARASASYQSLSDSVLSTEQYEETIQSEKTEFNTEFLQIIREITTQVSINGVSASVTESKLVDSVPTGGSLSGSQLRKRAEDYMAHTFGPDMAVRNFFKETICREKSKGTCKDDCCWEGPSRSITGGVRATGVGWPEKYASVEGCAKRCEQVSDFRAFHYYGDKDKHPSQAYTHCYLQKQGTIGCSLDDSRDRFAGVCN